MAQRLRCWNFAQQSSGFGSHCDPYESLVASERAFGQNCCRLWIRKVLLYMWAHLSLCNRGVQDVERP